MIAGVSRGRWGGEREGCRHQSCHTPAFLYIIFSQSDAASATDTAAATAAAAAASSCAGGTGSSSTGSTVVEGTQQHPVH